MKSELTRLTRNKEEFMTSIIDMFFDTNAITLKAIHPDSFRERTIKIRIFILQVDNKIANVVKTSEERKIRYVISLLRKVTTKWTTTHTDQYEETTFSIYQEFKKTFLERFTDSNSIEIVMKKLLNIKQEKLPIQKYATRVLNLINKTDLKN